MLHIKSIHTTVLLNSDLELDMKLTGMSDINNENEPSTESAVRLSRNHLQVRS